MIRFRPSVESLPIRVTPSDMGSLAPPMIDPPFLSYDPAPIPMTGQPTELPQIDWSDLMPAPDDSGVIRLQAETITRSTTLSAE